MSLEVLIWIALAVLLVMGTPIFVSLGMASITVLLLSDIPLSLVMIDLIKVSDMFPLLAVSFVLFNAADLPAAGQQIAALFGFGGLPASGVESLYYLRSYAVVLVIALLGATPLPVKAVQRLRDTSAGSAVLSAAEPVALVLLLALCTAYLVDGSFNPFLYFRF